MVLESVRCDDIDEFLFGLLGRPQSFTIIIAQSSQRMSKEGCLVLILILFQPVKKSFNSKLFKSTENDKNEWFDLPPKIL